MKYDYFLNGIFVGDSLHAFFLNGGKMNVFISDLNVRAVGASLYADWIPDLLYQRDGTIYSAISVRQVMENKALFDPHMVDSVKACSTELILKFKPNPKMGDVSYVSP